MINKYARIYFWSGSILCAIFSTTINILIIEWKHLHLSLGIIYLVIQFICSWTASEILLKPLLILFHKVKPVRLINDIGKTSFIINYNLKAYYNEEIDECLNNMYEAFINNMGINSIAVLISATTDPILQEYELSKIIYYQKLIYNELYNSGTNYIENNEKSFDDSWWCKLNIPNNLLKIKLETICKKRSQDFIILRRNSTTLKKCGQYQDLITLSRGHYNSYTYSNQKLYGKNARSNKSLFIDLLDNNYKRILRKNFKYTLVLDADTRVPKKSLIKLIGTANANPEYTIIQPRIDLYGSESLFQKFQVLCQQHSNIITKYTCSFMDHSSFYGKGLIRNYEYLKHCIGTSNNKIEYIPADALSHDTFESMALPVLYVPDIQLEETPPSTYISWNIREMRWNIGELIVARHLYPHLLCRKKTTPQCSNKFNLTFNKSFFALSSIRIIIMRPILLSFIILINFIPMKLSYIPMLYMLLTILIIPNLIIFKIKKFHEILLILLISIIQMTPEPAIGTIRLSLSLYELFKNKFKWVPSSKIEYNIKNNGIIYYSFLYYSPFMIISSILFYFFYNIHNALKFFLACNILLPFYSIFTGFNYNKILFKKSKTKTSKTTISKTKKPKITLAQLALDEIKFDFGNIV